MILNDSSGGLLRDMKNRKLTRSDGTRNNIIAGVSKGASKNTEETASQILMVMLDVCSVVKCECGAEILLVPDVKAMSHAIEVHVAEHIESTRLLRKKNRPTPSVSLAEEAERVRDALIAQAFNLLAGGPVSK